MIGEDDTIAVQIQANPRPTITWFIDLESVLEGRQDSTQRFTVSPTRSLVRVFLLLFLGSLI